MTPYRWRDAAGDGAMAFVVLAAFPRLADRLHWRTRLSPRGVVASIAFNTAMGFVLRAWLLPYLRRIEQQLAQAEKELGRKATKDELVAYFGVRGRARTTGR
jgi:hypothetical protein